MKKTHISLILFILFGFVFNNIALSWDDKVTHKDLSEYAAENSVLDISKGNYMKNLGFQDGLDEKFTWNNVTYQIRKWLREGAEFEDQSGKYSVGYLDGKARAFNHFHNPLKQAPWSDAGLDDWIILPPFHVTGKSSLRWAQDGAYQENFYEKDWSWNKTREHFYTALTGKNFAGSEIAPDEATKKEYFARTFRGLGHQMHLIQDATQPDHVRNDAHPEDSLLGTRPVLGGFYFETWAKKRFRNLSELKAFAPNPAFPNVPFNVSYDGLAPITQFIDAEQYNGISPSTNLTQGIAEYANANFFSDDTIFAAEIYSPGHEHYFPYPKKSSTDLQAYINGTKPPETVTARDGTTDTGIWISKVADGESISYFVRPSFMTSIIYNIFGEGSLYYRTFYRDNICHSYYAEKLLPRAVGYSAGLLNYFFRGKIDLVEDGLRYRIANLSDENMEGNLNSFKLFYDDVSDNRYEIPLTFFDSFGNQYTDPNTILSIPAKTNSLFTIELQSIPSNAKNLILVFKGKLGNEDNAVIGKVLEKIYFIVMPVDHTTRALLGKQFYSNTGIDSNMNAISVTDLPFGLLDDGAYWDTITSSYIAADPNGLGVSLGAGGPQYIAKYWDDANKKVRFVPNLSYEKEAYHAFNLTPKDQTTGQAIKDINYVTFIGSPMLSFGIYNENTGWMEYAVGWSNDAFGNPINSLLTILSPALSDPQNQRFFPLYKGINFNDVFVETPLFKAYNFDKSTYEINIPKDPNAPMPSIISAYKPQGADYVRVSIPSVFNTYVMPNPYWVNSATIGSSGLDYYRFYSSSTAYESHEDKCISEDNNCGNVYDPNQGPESIKTIFDIPYNYNSYVRVHRSPYYEELYINGQLVETSTASTTQLETHYQILAVYKDMAVIRETNYISYSETPLNYWYSQNFYRIYEKQWNFTSSYYIYVKGVRYNLTGTTNIKSRYLATPYAEIPEEGTASRVNYLTFEMADDITGYHIDRIFISDSFDRQHILVAFDEYAYNNGAGLVHQLKYDPSDVGDGKYILYHDIPVNEIQNADHEGTRVGRKLLLFRSDGTLKTNLQDPIGLNYTVGSIGILN